MTRIVYAIPTFRRPDRLVTVDTLIRHGVDPCSIQVWCSDPAEVGAYTKAVPAGVWVGPGAPGLAANRAAIIEAQPISTRLVQLDDDIHELLVKTADNKLRPLPISLPEVADRAFELVLARGCHLWGINAAANGGFMKHTNTIGLRYCIGAMYGTIVEPVPCPCDLSAGWSDSGEDFRRTLECWSHWGAVVRLDWLTIKTKYFAGGGIDQALAEAGQPDRQADHAEQLQRIADEWPDLATAYRKAGNVLNLRLRVITESKAPAEVLA